MHWRVNSCYGPQTSSHADIKVDKRPKVTRMEKDEAR
jgi:hypothetical protein